MDLQIVDAGKVDSRRKYEFLSTSIGVADGGRSAIAGAITTVSVDVLTDPSENPESWREGEGECGSRGDPVPFIREGSSAERGNAGETEADFGIARRISGKLFFTVNEGLEGLEPAAYEALRVCCDWLVPNTFAVSSSEDTELSGVGR